jgi:hypothetical protein
MINSVKIYSFLRFILIIFLLYSLLIVFTFIFCPTVTFATTPPIEEVVDYYGNTEYVGKDPYGHSITREESNIVTSQDISKVGDQYGSNPPYERD